MVFHAIVDVLLVLGALGGFASSVWTTIVLRRDKRTDTRHLENVARFDGIDGNLEKLSQSVSQGHGDLSERIHSIDRRLVAVETQNSTIDKIDLLINRLDLRAQRRDREV